MAKKRLYSHYGIGLNNRQNPPIYWVLFGKLVTDNLREIIHDDYLLEKCYCNVRCREYDEWFLATHEIFNNQILEEQPILIRGHKGSGKSTYVHYHFKVYLKENNTVEAIIIDFKKFVGNVHNDGKIIDFINEQIHKHLRDRHPELNAKNIDSGIILFDEQFEDISGIANDLLENGNINAYQEMIANELKNWINNREIYNRARIKKLHNDNKKVLVVVDNVDHFPKAIQEKIFQSINYLITALDVQIIMTIRETTFNSSSQIISAYEPIFLNLSNPNTRKILYSRIISILDNKELDWNSSKVQLIIKEKRIIADKEDTMNELNNILDALLKNDGVLRILESLANYDMRYMLEIVRIAMSSGYLFPKDDYFSSDIAYNFLRAVMCGNNRFYKESGGSVVVNLFDNNQPSYFGNNLIRLRTLQTIRYLGGDSTVHNITKFMKTLGYSEDKIVPILQHFLNHGLIYSPNYEGLDIVKDKIDEINLTTSGDYYLDNLVFNTLYLQEISASTYINEETFNKIIALDRNNKTNRFIAIRHFINYLQLEEEEETNRTTTSKVNSVELENISDKALVKLYEACEKIGINID